MLGTEPGYPLLLGELLHLARCIGGVFDAGAEACSPMVARDQVLVRQLVDIPADSLRRDVEMLRQGVDRHEAALAHQFDDAGMSLVALHETTFISTASVRHLATDGAYPKVPR